MDYHKNGMPYYVNKIQTFAFPRLETVRYLKKQQRTAFLCE